MAVNNVFKLTAYGEKNPSQVLAKLPIITNRAPTAADKSILGQLWVNKATNAYYVLTSIANGGSVWTAQATGSGSFAAVTVTGGTGDVLVVNAGGDTVLGGTLDVAGATVLSDDLTVDGDVTGTGGDPLSTPSGIEISSAGFGVSLPGGIMVISGAGSPEGVVTAPIGSLFLRSDPIGSTSRLYVNIDDSDGWTNVTCAA
jgi:hypothetical protein